MNIIQSKAVGIICEYNPIHSGHIYQIEKVRQMGAETIVCLMSGHFTQRGDFALADKYLRAESAIKCGADLILELPFPYCCSSADYFAKCGVYILDALWVDSICFGSESAELDQLYKLAQTANSTEFEAEYKSQVKGAVGTASAYFDTLNKLSSKTNKELLSNDILGLSYIKAILKGDCDIEPIIIKRLGSTYDREDLPEKTGEFASATALRGEILKDGSRALKSLADRGFISFDVSELYESFAKEQGFSDIKTIERAILLYLRLNRNSIIKSKTAEFYGGLIERICKTAGVAKSFDELIRLSATKKYTDSTVKRAIIHALCGVCQSDLQNPPGYINLLAANSKGRMYLSEVRNKSGITIITKPADRKQINGDFAHRQKQLEDISDSLYTLSYKEALCSDIYIKKQPYVEK